MQNVTYMQDIYPILTEEEKEAGWEYIRNYVADDRGREKVMYCPYDSYQRWVLARAGSQPWIRHLKTAGFADI